MTASSMAGLELGGRRTYDAMESAGEVTLAREAERQTDVHQAGIGGAQHALRVLDSTLQHIVVWRHSKGLLEQAREMMQAQIRDPGQLAEGQCVAEI